MASQGTFEAHLPIPGIIVRLAACITAEHHPQLRWQAHHRASIDVARKTREDLHDERRLKGLGETAAYGWYTAKFSNLV